jgi:integration host factor subunit beta
MNKSDLLQLLSDKFPLLTTKDIKVSVEAILDVMMATLCQRDRIEIRGFGSFSIKTRAARIGRNPRTGEKVFVTSRSTINFKSGREMKRRVNEYSNTADFDTLSESSEPQKKAACY